MYNLLYRTFTNLTAITFVAIFFFFATVIQANAATFYVSKSGNNQNGQSWGSAWNELNQINWSAVNPGDTIFLDGGASSMTYTTTLAPSKSGTSGNPITIRLSSEAERNGRAIIHGGRQAPLPECGQRTYNPYANESQVNQLREGIKFENVSYVVVDGGKWEGIEITRNENGVRYYDNTSHTTLRNLRIHDNGSVFQDNDGSVSDLWYSSSPGIRVEGTHHTFERLHIHDNGQDNIQSGGGLQQLTHLTIKESWLHNQRVHSGIDNGPSGDSGDELGAPQKGPSYNGFDESFNWCTHSDAVQVFDSGSSNASNFLFENTIFGPGHTNTLILGDTSGGGATITDLTMRNVLIVKGADNNINGKDGPSNHRNWNLQNITVYSPNTKSNGIRLFGNNHHISNTIFQGANAFFESNLATDTGNCVYDMSGDSFGSINDEPLFTSVSSDPFSLDDYSLRAGSPCAGKGSSLTSVSQLLSIVGGGGPLPSPTIIPSPLPSILPTPTPPTSPVPTPTPPTCAEDINEDRKVNLLDYSILSSDFFKDNPTNPRSNIDGLGKVDLRDYSRLATRFMDDC
jgi:hypothetical protein